MKPTVKLVTFTHEPVASVYHVWEASKTDGPIPSVEEIKASPELAQKAQDLFWQVIRQRIPVGEHINFVFMLEGVSISFREQMVRHRVGVKVGDRIGLDIIPDLDQSSWWSQSMRIQDMGAFAKRGLYRVPETLAGKTCPEHWGITSAEKIPADKLATVTSEGKINVLERESAPAEEIFREAMDNAQRAYAMLVAAGVPMEDAREVIPLGAQHRISWALNLQTLLHVLGKRGCWILQLGLWGPIIEGMVKALADGVHESFRTLLAPPCVDAHDKFSSCLYPVENQRRIDGRDDHPVCPLYICRDMDAEEQLGSGGRMGEEGEEFYRLPFRKRQPAITQLRLPRTAEMEERAESYRRLWGHDPYLWDKEFAK